MRIKIFLAQIFCLFIFFIFVKSIIRMKIFLAQIYCLLFFVYYCKKYDKNENISRWSLLFVIFCLFMWNLSYQWKYFLRKFIASSFLFIIVKSDEWKSFWHKFITFFFLFIFVKIILQMKIFLAQTYSLLLLFYYCKKYHMNENISVASLLLVPFWFWY